MRLILKTLQPGLLWCLLPTWACAGTVLVAVAANFTDPAKDIAAAFAEATGHRALLSFGATGQLYTQMTQGAPFQVFLAGDDKHASRAITEGYGVPGSVFTYAIGELGLYTAQAGQALGVQVLKDGDFQKLAIANPATAPYGLAAVQVLNNLGLNETLQAKIVQGQNISQTYQFVATGNAQLGFVSLSQIALHDTGSRWIVPKTLYDPIRQDAVLLTQGERQAAATAFMTFLQSPRAEAIIRKYGYSLSH